MKLSTQKENNETYATGFFIFTANVPFHCEDFKNFEARVKGRVRVVHRSYTGYLRRNMKTRERESNGESCNPIT